MAVWFISSIANIHYTIKFVVYWLYMVSEQKEWVKAHKKDFVDKQINESNVVADGIPSAVFMAGLPGSGKTEFTKNLIEASALKVIRLDMDEIATKIDGYRPEIADEYREAASELLNRLFDVTIKKKLDFIMDGTFSSNYALQNVNRALKHGYNIKIIYIVQDPKIAWQFTLAREKVEHRAIGMSGFINSYFETIKNIKEIMNQHKDYGKIVLDVIIKDENNNVGDRIKNVQIGDIDGLIKKYYNKEDLEEYING